MFLIRLHVHGEHDELVAAQAGENVGLAEHLAEKPRHVAQGLVSARVAEGVVDVLQAVHVDEEQDEIPLPTLGEIDVLAAAGKESAAVVQPGELVEDRDAFQPPVGPLQLLQRRFELTRALLHLALQLPGVGVDLVHQRRALDGIAQLAQQRLVEGAVGDRRPAEDEAEVLAPVVEGQEDERARVGPPLPRGEERVDELGGRAAGAGGEHDGQGNRVDVLDPRPLQGVLIETHEKRGDSDAGKRFVEVSGENGGIECEGALFVELVEHDVGVAHVHRVRLLQLLGLSAQVFKPEGVQAHEHVPPAAGAVREPLQEAVEEPFQKVEPVSEGGEEALFFPERGFEGLQEGRALPRLDAALNGVSKARETSEVLVSRLRDDGGDHAAAGSAYEHPRGERDRLLVPIALDRLQDEVDSRLSNGVVGLADRRDRRLGVHAVFDIVESGDGHRPRHGDAAPGELLHGGDGDIVR